MNKKGFPCRCKICKRRKTFKHKPWEYLRKFKFLFCCGQISWTVDNYRMNKEYKINKCQCDGYHFPHRKGGGWCIYNPNYEKLQEEYHHFEN